MRFRIGATALAFAAVALVACGNSNKVGSGVEVDGDADGGRGALGGATTTIAPAVTVATTTPPTTARAVQTTIVQPSITIKIQGDTQGNAFEPSNARVFVGSIVRWTNVDKVGHEIQAARGEFKSGPIAAGQSYDYRATAVGTFQYTDPARPYAVGVLQVLAR